MFIDKKTAFAFASSGCSTSKFTHTHTHTHGRVCVTHTHGHCRRDEATSTSRGPTGRHKRKLFGANNKRKKHEEESCAKVPARDTKGKTKDSACFFIAVLVFFLSNFGFPPRPDHKYNEATTPTTTSARSNDQVLVGNSMI